MGWLRIHLRPMAVILATLAFTGLAGEALAHGVA